MPTSPKDKAFFIDLFGRSTELVEHYGIKGNPVHQIEGLEGIVDALNEMRVGFPRDAM